MRTTYAYDTATHEERRLCDERPRITLVVTETRIDTWRDDGAVVTKEHPPRIIATFNVDPNEGEKR